MEFSGGALKDYETAISREWVITNGLGGYSSSTAVGVNTRKYHGLLVVPTTTPPFGRKLLLSKLEDEIQTSSETFHLSANEYPDVIYPDGHAHVKQFRLDPLPTFTYSFPGFLVKKTIFMPYRTNAVIVNYKVWNPSEQPAKMLIRPLVNSRDIHHLTRSGSVSFKQQAESRKVEVVARYQDAPPLLIGSDLMSYVPSELPEEARWYKNVVYREERERGYEFMEDHYSPGHLELELKGGKSEFNLLATGGFRGKGDFELLYSEKPEKVERERQMTVDRLEGLVKGSAVADTSWGRYLIWAADSFIANGRVIAGYHWFGCWGRDSMISLPGLTLVTGRYDVAKRILLDLANRRRGGLMPNWFEGETADYNCADVSLLFIYALHKYLTYTDDVALANKLWGALTEIVDSYVRGLNEGVSVDEGGLVCSDRGTWMDVKVGDKCVTPRQGKAVEINALWYNALRAMEAIAERTGRVFKFAGLAEKVRKNFFAEFWNEDRRCLYDVVGDDFRDQRIRPNQILAVSLPFPAVAGPQAEEIVSTVKEKLLTPYGLRSLERGDPSYKGVYKGNVIERDFAYHQGTTWSWLIGPFVTAFLRVHKEPGSQEQAMRFLQRLVGSHLIEAGIGTVSEIFDGDEPHTPRGCISQAWSVAEILRAYVENIKSKRPPFEDKYGGTT
ncbi:MAG: amylo-alpha-1,6-glucosidase [Candidatus Hodarchaeaceae archaeon]|nr:amylo-alpha-1,6-glucosidase [Candidatus Hodarchaeaceae archaeon]